MAPSIQTAANAEDVPNMAVLTSFPLTKRLRSGFGEVRPSVGEMDRQPAKGNRKLRAAFSVWTAHIRESDTFRWFTFKLVGNVGDASPGLDAIAPQPSLAPRNGRLSTRPLWTLDGHLAGAFVVRKLYRG